MSRNMREAELKSLYGKRYGAAVVSRMGGRKRDRRKLLTEEVEKSYQGGSLDISLEEALESIPEPPRRPYMSSGYPRPDLRGDPLYPSKVADEALLRFLMEAGAFGGERMRGGSYGTRENVEWPAWFTKENFPEGLSEEEFLREFSRQSKPTYQEGSLPQYQGGSMSPYVEALEEVGKSRGPGAYTADLPMHANTMRDVARAMQPYTGAMTGPILETAGFANEAIDFIRGLKGGNGFDTSDLVANRLGIMQGQAEGGPGPLDRAIGMAAGAVRSIDPLVEALRREAEPGVLSLRRQ